MPREAPEDVFFVITDAALPGGLSAENLTEVRLKASNAAFFDHVRVARAVGRIRPDVFLATKNTVPLGLSCPVVSIFLDLAYFAMPGAYPCLDNIYMRAMFRRSAKTAAGIIAISESTREDVRRFLAHCAYAKTRVVYPGLDAAFRPFTPEEKAAARESLPGLPERFVLYPGNISPRKNVGGLLDAMEKIAPSIGLVITGHRSWKSTLLMRRIEEASRGRDVRILGAVSDGKLAALYNLAGAVVYPSLYEGFGFPVIESLGCGTPLAASNSASIPEIAGDAALVVDARDAAALARAIKTALFDEEARSALIARGLERAKAFTWEKTARETLSVLRQVL